MNYRLSHTILGLFFLIIGTVIDTRGMTPDEMVKQATSTSNTTITGKWKLIAKNEKSLLHGERIHYREKYKKAVIYDFSTPNKLKISREGKLEVYDYVIKNNVITIYWDEHMSVREGIEYTIKMGNGKLNLHYEETPTVKPNYSTVDYDLESMS